MADKSLTTFLTEWGAQVDAMIENSSASDTPTVDGGETGSETAPSVDVPFTERKPPEMSSYEIYDGDDNVILRVPRENVTILSYEEANQQLTDDDKENLIIIYFDELKNLEGYGVLYYFWLDVSEQYKTEDFNYFKCPFTASVDNIEVLVNGTQMEPVQDGDNWYAKLTEFGAVAIIYQK